ncbi:hypothetical protein [Candidatus Collinsella stercoripullorum]|uniref:hypothetical protein n=1 Tax=Candidatus Collinsella stercoripullorum TaxID=2838522 RepID=UPI0022E78E7E|nr:hypothetical protein [Candidatus Collinsella stercoripullorum]
MDTRAQKPNLSVGNQIYLYRLLSESIGCGRQTIMGKVEEALAADRMGAEDLGFESTRALLEALDAFVALTVFKGGRIYATVTAQPAWDEALAAPEKQAAPAGKSWKRKKADKSLKPVRPRRVKRAVEAAPDAEAEAPDRDGAAGAADAGDAAKDTPGGAAGGSPAPTEAAPDKAAPGAEGPSQPRAAEAAATPSEPAGERGPARDESTGGAEPAAQQADSPKVASPVSDEGTAHAKGAGSAADGEAPSSEDAASPAEPAREPASQPAISLTVVYDPENANAGVTTLESTPDAGGRAAASEAALPDTDTTEAASPEAASPDADATDVASPDADATDVASSEPGTPEADSPARTQASPSPAGADGAKPRAARPPRAPRNRTDCAGARSGRSAADDADSRIRGDRGTAPVPSEPRPLPEGYPADLTRDVYCPGPVLHELALLLPLGADALGILDAYYRIAQLLGTLEAGRNRASFPLGYLRDGERLTATVRLRRKRGDAGAAWVVDAVEAPTDSTADGR